MGLSRLLGKAKLTLNSKAPEVWFINGCICFVGALVLSGKSALKYKTLKEQLKADLKEQEEFANDFDEMKDENGTVDGITYTPAERKKEIRQTKINFVVDSVVAYVPTVGLAAASLFCFGKSYGVLKGWYIGMTSAYLSMAKYSQYLEDKLAKATAAINGLKNAEEIVYDENGNLEEPVENDLEAGPGVFEVFFGPSNPNFTGIFERDVNFVENKVAFAENLIFKAKGYMFMNELLDLIEIDWSRAGQMFGWIDYEDDIEEMNRNGASGFISVGTRLEDPNFIERRRRLYEQGYGLLLRLNVDRVPIINRCGME